ncbi:NADP-dependent oxidoreductase [Blastococcus sp. SYSU D00695]
MQTTQIRLAERPVAEPEARHFETVVQDLPEVGEGQVLLRTIYLSLDPYMRSRMNTAKSYAAPWEVGDVCMGATVCEVVESRSSRLAVGDIVLSYVGWQTHAVVSDQVVMRLDPMGVPVSTTLGVLGMPGFTGYAGLLEIGRPKEGETVVVAAATGPVGSVVGQVARLKGARAVGIAGGPEKCRVLLEEFGFDAAVDHRSPTFVDDLAAATPDGVDVYFENVGGAVGEAVVERLNRFARVPVCGLVSSYNGATPADGGAGLHPFLRRVLSYSLQVRGFVQDEFLPTHHEAFLRDMSGWLRDGSVRYREDVVDGLENTVEAFRGLLTGKNMGKLLVRVGEGPTQRAQE